MAKMALLFSLTLLAANLINPSMPAPPAAGECLDSAENYLEEMEAISDVSPASEADRRRILSALYCLYQNDRFRKGYEYPETFASPSAIREVRDENKKTEGRCFEVIPKFLKSSSPLIRCEAVRVLTYYGWPDSFKPIMQCDGGPEIKAFLLSMLGDKRATPWIIEQYKRADKRYRAGPAFSYEHSRTVYMNALYHLASPEQLSFIEEVISRPKPATIKSRAEKVRDRIHELYPESRNVKKPRPLTPDGA